MTAGPGLCDILDNAPKAELAIEKLYLQDLIFTDGPGVSQPYNIKIGRADIKEDT